MNTLPLAQAVCLADEHLLDLEPFAAACGADPDFVRALVHEGLLSPAELEPGWRFAGEQLARARRIRRLQHAFEANLASVAVMLDLIDEVERLRSLLVRAGLQTEASGGAPAPRHGSRRR